MSTIETRLNSSFFTAAAILLAVVGILFFYHLDEDEVSSDSEARIMLTAGEMNRTGTWAIPTVGSQGRWEKPPLYVWSVKLASYLTEGKVTPLTSRLPGAVAMSLLVLLASWWAFKHFSAYPRADGLEINAEGFALLSGLLLATNPELMDLARSGVSDSIFAFFCFAAIYFLGQSFESRRSFYSARSWRHYVFLAYFFIGLAMLTKGPAAFLFVLIPYMAMCWTYKLRRPDSIHLYGILIALVVGGWWYVFAAVIDREAARVFIRELLTERFGSGAESYRPFYFYFDLALRAYFPWNLLAAAMVYRNLRLGDRTPTLVTWSCALLSGIFWLSIVGSKKDEYFLPVAPFILLLAGDALMRWDFDSRAGQAFRGLIRTLRYAMILLGIPLSILLGSEAGIILTIAAFLICVLFALHRRRTNYTYAVWERTVHAAALLVLLLGIYEVVYALDYVPRQDFRSRTSAFMEQIDKHLPKDAPVYIYDRDNSALISYYLGKLPRIIFDVNDLEKAGPSGAYLVSDADVKDLAENPRLVPLVVRTRSDSRRYRSAFFQYIPKSKYPDPITQEQRMAAVPSLRLAVFGDIGHGGRQNQHDVAARLDRMTSHLPPNGILMIGDPFTAGSKLERVDFYSSFERPFKHQLGDGIPLYGLLGREDQDIAWFVTHYPLLQMGNHRYYKHSFYAGLVDYFALDVFSLEKSNDDAEAQWKWIEEELSGSKALWKIVGVYKPVISLSPDPMVDKGVSERLLPILDRYGVQLVLSAGEPVYQRIKDPDHTPVFVVAGWSGEAKSKRFPDDPRLRCSYSRTEGFAFLSFASAYVDIRAVNKHGQLVDKALIRRDGSVDETSLEEIAGKAGGPDASAAAESLGAGPGLASDVPTTAGETTLGSMAASAVGVD